LRVKSDGAMPDDFFSDILDEHFGPDEARHQLDTAIHWGRYAELFDYDANSLLRLGIAYGLSLSFALVYGYLAAYRAKLERVLIPLLDILQSIPVLSFLPGVMLAMIALFPRRQLGVEMGAILLIFTGQVWNMAFSF